MGLGRQNILVVGSGGREHAIGWKLQQDSDVGNVYHAPGNGGICKSMRRRITDTRNLIEFARSNECFTIVGPEAPLSHGIVDAFNAAGLPIVGPTQKAARLEYDKCFGKEFMVKNGIPTPDFEFFDDPNDAKAYAKSRSNIVVKWNGLADGKGVKICYTGEDAVRAIDCMVSRLKSGQPMEKIIVEKLLPGDEITYQVLTDGKVFRSLPASQDHKRVGNGNTGLMTGGMGAYSPVPILTPELEETIRRRFVKPTIEGMARNDTPISGFLYFGLMVMPSKTGPEPYLLEYNVRLGDPEAQTILPLLDYDLLPFLEATINGKLDKQVDISWTAQSSVTVVMSAKGYPREGIKFSCGELIRGVDDQDDQNALVFHSRTERAKGGKLVTSGCGRVLSVTGIGVTLEEAASNAYYRVERIGPELHYRTDIAESGIKALRRMESQPA